MLKIDDTHDIFFKLPWRCTEDCCVQIPKYLMWNHGTEGTISSRHTQTHINTSKRERERVGK